MRSLENLLISIQRKLLSFVVAAALLGLGFVATTFDSALAQGQAVILAPAQVAAIQAQITAAINAANMQQFNNMVVDPAALIVCNCTRPNVDRVNTMQCDNAARTAALAQAITNVTLNLIGQFGPSAAGDITSIVIATSMAQNVPASAVGIGLGRAAQQLGTTNGPAAILIAQDLANEGTADIDNCFSLADPILAAVVTGPPVTTGAPPTPPGPPTAPPPIAPVLAVSAS
jgi:hypothetical protein